MDEVEFFLEDVILKLSIILYVMVLLICLFPVLAITPDVISFNKEGQEIIGTIALKNQTADQCISYKV